jgi:CHAT domain-containing protein/tetratricopeptide (TPR) repeat protein
MHSVLAASRAYCPAILLTVLISSAGASVAAPADRTGALQVEVDSLRRAGQYDKAAEGARALLLAIQGDETRKPYQMADAERLIRTLQLAAALPDSARDRLAEADRLTAEVIRAFQEGHYRLGEQHARRQLEIRRELLGENHADVAWSLNALANFLGELGDSHGAESHYRQAIAVRRTLSVEHPDLSRNLQNLAMLLRDKGDHASAEPLLRESIEMWRKLFGEIPPDRLNSLAMLLFDRGEYGAAEPLFRESLARARSLHGETHLDVVQPLSNLGKLLDDRGDYPSAEPLLRESLALWRKLFGEEHPLVATGLSNLSSVLHKRGDRAGAERLLTESLEISRKLLGQDHPHVAMTLCNLSILRREQGDFAGAESLLQEALVMQRRLLGEEHVDIAGNMVMHGSLLFDRGEYAGAERLYRESLRMRSRLLGEEHPAVASTLFSLAYVMQVAGNHAGAESVLTEAARVYEVARLRTGSALARATAVPSPYPLLAASRLALGREEGAWPAAERSQGRLLADLLASAGHRRLSPGESGQERALGLALDDRERELRAFQEALLEDSSREASARTVAARTRLLEAESRWEAFQQSVAARHPLTEGLAYDLDHVQRTLRSDEALIGWLDHPEERAVDRGLMSWGYVVRPQGPVHWKRTGRQAALVEDLGEHLRRWFRIRQKGTGPPEKLSVAQVFRAEVSRRPVDPSDEPLNAGRLWEERLEPLMPHLAGVEHLIVVPSGDMLGIPVEALRIGGGSQTMGDRFEVSYVPSGTIHAWLAERGNQGKRPEERRDRPPRADLCLAIGDPPFHADDLAEIITDQGLASAANGSEAWLFRSLARLDDSLGIEKEEDLWRSALAGNRGSLRDLRRLPSTREEARQVRAIHGGDSRLLLGADATEQELVSMAAAGQLKKFRTIHIATHALIDDQRPENSALILSQVGLPDALEAAINGNRIFDGCLTAGEIVREWELDADLVTLSACETALGKKVAGEGYIGFAHAFLQAGARSLLVSLWKVEDRSTAMLMQRFYENTLGRTADPPDSSFPARSGAPMSKVEALREAKRWVREWQDGNGNRPYAHPFFWAGFILIGDAH